MNSCFLSFLCFAVCIYTRYSESDGANLSQRAAAQGTALRSLWWERNPSFGGRSRTKPMLACLVVVQPHGPLFKGRDALAYSSQL